MIQLIMGFLSFLQSALPLLFSVAFLAVFFILLSKSIKKYYYIYYTLSAIPFVLMILPFLLSLCGIQTEWGFNQIPVLGNLMRDYMHMAGLGHPILIIIMYVGALDAKNAYVKRLMSIRKEISIISGFPVLTHGIIRAFRSWPKSLEYFTNHEEFMSSPRITSALGAGITNTVLFLGIIMLLLFFILWITSFDSVHRKLGGLRWKKVQKWSYVLYALLFVHAIGLQLGRMISSSSENKPLVEQVQVAEVKANHEQAQTKRPERAERLENETEPKHEHNQVRAQGNSEGQQVQPQEVKAEQERVQIKGKPKAWSFEDIEIERETKSWISIFSLLLIYGSYLVLRVRKHQKKMNKKKHANA